MLLVNLAGARMHDRECRVLLRTIGTVDEVAVAHVAKKHKVGAQTDSGGVQQPARRRQQCFQLKLRAVILSTRDTVLTIG